MERFRNQSREHSELSAIVSLYEQYRQAERDAEAARELVGDAQMKAFADDELKSARAAMERLEAELQKALLPEDPNDAPNNFLAVRGGAGGAHATTLAGRP